MAHVHVRHPPPFRPTPRSLCLARSLANFQCKSNGNQQIKYKYNNKFAFAYKKKIATKTRNISKTEPKRLAKKESAKKVKCAFFIVNFFKRHFFDLDRVIFLLSRSFALFFLARSHAHTRARARSLR